MIPGGVIYLGIIKNIIWRGSTEIGIGLVLKTSHGVKSIV